MVTLALSPILIPEDKQTRLIREVIPLTASLQLPPLKQVMETVPAGRFLLHNLQNEDLSGFTKFIIFSCLGILYVLTGIKLVNTAMQRSLHKEEETYTIWIKAKNPGNNNSANTNTV